MNKLMMAVCAAMTLSTQGFAEMGVHVSVPLFTMEFGGGRSIEDRAYLIYDPLHAGAAGEVQEDKDWTSIETMAVAAEEAVSSDPVERGWLGQAADHVSDNKWVYIGAVATGLLVNQYQDDGWPFESGSDDKEEVAAIPNNVGIEVGDGTVGPVTINVTINQNSGNDHKGD